METPSPSPTTTPQIALPLAKIVVQNARVSYVSYATQTVSNDTTGTSLVIGNPTALEIIVPYDAAEMVLMSSQAGILQIIGLPYSADNVTRKPSIGASMQDVLDLFYADRESIALLTPTATPMPAQSE
jgi:hypothetical protein